tara:strand:+ start:99 stop:632 length:534 start_codon:yes stop_codon:yes gene_type:complete
MYLPKSKYKGPFTASGGSEAILYKDTLKPFNGQYIITFKKQLFEGTDPVNVKKELIFESEHLNSLNTTSEEPKPIGTVVSPTKKDYIAKEFTRYFVKDNRSGKIVEVDSKEHTKAANYPSYTTTKLNWWLEGPAEDTKFDGITYHGAITRHIKAIKAADNKVSGIKDYLFLLDEFVV